jgi:hypothetical protein
LDACCRFSTSSLHNLSTWWGYFVCFYTGKARLWRGYSLPLMKGDRLNFSSYLKCRPEGRLINECCSNFFDDRHWDACICLWQMTGDLLFFLVPSIRIAHLLAYSVLIRSLAELYLAFCMGNVLAFAVGLKLSLAGWYHQWLSSWL